MSIIEIHREKPEREEDNQPKKLPTMGERFLDDGRKFIGEFNGDSASCTGTILWPNGDEYAGEHRFFVPMGLGRKRYANGTSYSGIWFDGVYMGPMTRFYHDGSVYTGDTNLHKKHGKGTAIWRKDGSPGSKERKSFSDHFSWFWNEDNRRDNSDWKFDRENGLYIAYSGEWVNDVFHGYGKLITNYFEYEGEFRDGDCHGYGKITDIDGTVYEGSVSRTGNRTMRVPSYRNVAIPFGIGKMRYLQGGVKEGLWIEGEYVGAISEQYEDGSVFVREVGDASSIARGTRFWPQTNDFYIGDCVDGKRQGQGTMYWVEDVKIRGVNRTIIIGGHPAREGTVFSDYYLIENIQSYKKIYENRNCAWIYEVAYQGTWKNDMPIGQDGLFNGSRFTSFSGLDDD